MPVVCFAPAGLLSIGRPRAAVVILACLTLFQLTGSATVRGADSLPQEGHPEAASREAGSRGEAWQRHTVDRSSRGADGVRLADINGDGSADIVTGWEEGGQIRLALNPGTAQVRQLWPSVVIGRVKSAEDAVFFDADRDGRLDVVSSCEGGTRSLFVHWSPADASQLLEDKAWTTSPVPASRGSQRWMYAVPAEIDGKPGRELVAAGKGANAEIGWWQLPEKSREPAEWKWHPIATVGWVMSIEPLDVDSDGDTDLLVTDRRGIQRGLWWFEHPGNGGDDPAGRSPGDAAWPRRLIGGREREVMFLATGDLDGDDRVDVLTADSAGAVLWYHRDGRADGGWQETVIPFPGAMGTGKGIAEGDLNLDGRADIVLTCERAGGKSGAVWLTRPAGSSPADPGAWAAREISGQSAGAGVKFDLIQLLDLDGDGDLDVLTCEERDNLGVIWYENPAR